MEPCVDEKVESCSSCSDDEPKTTKCEFFEECLDCCSGSNCPFCDRCKKNCKCYIDDELTKQNWVEFEDSNSHETHSDTAEAPAGMDCSSPTNATENGIRIPNTEDVVSGFSSDIGNSEAAPAMHSFDFGAQESAVWNDGPWNEAESGGVGNGLNGWEDCMDWTGQDRFCDAAIDPNFLGS